MAPHEPQFLAPSGFNAPQYLHLTFTISRSLISVAFPFAAAALVSSRRSWTAKKTRIKLTTNKAIAANQ